MRVFLKILDEQEPQFIAEQNIQVRAALPELTSEFMMALSMMLWVMSCISYLKFVHIYKDPK